MTGGWKQVIFKVLCSPNLNSRSFQRSSPYKQDGGEVDKKGIKRLEAPACSGFSRFSDGHLIPWSRQEVRRFWKHLRTTDWADRQTEIGEFCAFA